MNVAITALQTAPQCVIPYCGNRKNALNETPSNKSETSQENT